MPSANTTTTTTPSRALSGFLDGVALPGASKPLSQADAIRKLIDPSYSPGFDLGFTSDIKFKGRDGSSWSDADYQALSDVISAMPPKDRAALRFATFERVPTLPKNHEGHDNYGEIRFDTRTDRNALTVSIADVASKDGVVKDVAAHEIGHAVQGGGRWDPDSVREFGKLSHWVKAGPPEALVNGYGKLNSVVDIEEGTLPKNAANFVSDYAKGSAMEDFAESYRVYLNKPEDLMKAAPEKFLYLNAQSKKFTPAQVADLAAKSGTDLGLVMAEMQRTGLRPQTLVKIGDQNGLVGAGGTGTAAGDAIALIQGKIDDPSFVTNLKANPEAALGGDLWGRLSESERSMLRDPAKLAKVAEATAANKAAPPDKVTDSEVDAWKKFFKQLASPDTEMLLGESEFDDLFGESMWTGGRLGEPTAQAVDDKRLAWINQKLHRPVVWDKFSPETQALLNSEKGQAYLKAMADDQNNLDLARLIWTKRDLQGSLTAMLNIDKYVDGIGPAEVEATLDMIRGGLGTAELKQVSEANSRLASTGAFPVQGGSPAY